jgi:pyruvate/2-oxoglutarate dehydrogenase complex dihydrolipoamide acyltransferase (E2) component
MEKSLVRHTVKLPKLGESSNEVVVVELYVEVGQRVAAGDPLVRVETSKVEVDVEVPASGTVTELLVRAEDEVVTGDPIATIEG